MRYHWGLGVGHLYSHGDAPNAAEEQPNEEDSEDDGFEQAGKCPILPSQFSL